MGEIIKVIEWEEMTRIANAINSGAMDVDLAHCIEENRFYVYKNGYWQEIYEVELLKEIATHSEFKFVVKHAISKRKQIIENLKILTQRRLELFNVKGYLNFDVGEFDPLSIQMLDHDKENYSTMRIDYPFDGSAKCPLWEKTLLEIFENDVQKVGLLQEFIGYCITPDISHKKALLLLGDTDSGKSTILNILRLMLGAKNCSSVPLKYLSHPQYTPMMINKFANIDADVAKDAQSYEAEFKIITSGEPISCNQKFVETFEFVPRCKIVLAANIFPTITDHSSAFYSRLILIPCNRRFSEQEKNRNLVKQLTEELAGIFNWAVAGLRRLNERGMFPQDNFMLEAVKELEDINNPTNIFFEDHVEIEIGDHVHIEKGVLYEYYKAWAMKSGHGYLTLARFSEAVYKKFSKVTPKTTNLVATGKRIWRNLKYVDGTTDQQSNWND
jgi:putative DNA primase/helicase